MGETKLVKTDGVVTNWMHLFQLATRKRANVLADKRFWYTLNYLWYICRACILVRIKGGHLYTFIAFANPDFENNWDLAKFLPPLKEDWPEEAKSPAAFPLKNWWCNAGILCTSYGPSVWGKSFLRDLALCLERAASLIPHVDMEFFLNKRDFPNVRKDGKDPYSASFFGALNSIVDVAKLLPIYSSYTGHAFADKSFPLMQDYSAEPSWWHSISNFDEFRKDWKGRHSIAVFRGSATGCGVRVDNNPRLELDALVKELSASGDPASSHFDVKITGRNQRIRKHPNDLTMQVIESATEDERSHFLHLKDQRLFKFAIYVEGHSAASRLGALLGAGFLVFALNTKSAPADRLFFSDKLIDGIHLVRCNIEDLTSLVVKFASTDGDDDGLIIAWNAMLFHRQFLSRSAIETFVASSLDACV